MNIDNNFDSSTLDDKLQEINNGYLSDIKVVNEQKGKIEMRDPIIFHNTSESAVKGIIEESALSENFFSELNIKLLQQWLRYEIYKKKNKVIEYQSTQELNIIMRSIFLQYGDSRVSSNDFIEHIQSLNQKVIGFSLNRVLNQLDQYDGYIDKLERLPVPMEFPKYENKNNFTYDISNLL
tara:strand:- start:392 stop:931 length:540 start_codon:yes stop_codon:yes gene_type:complete